MLVDEESVTANLGNNDEFARVERRLVEVAAQGHAVANVVDEFGETQAPVGVVDRHRVLVELGARLHVRS